MKRRFAEANRPPQDTSWCWLTAEMLESAAWRALTGNAMKVVLRIALEHLKHGGVDNGLLPVTYQDFVKCRVRRNAVRHAILIAIHLGWVEKTSTGEVPWHGNIRRPSTFALTWLPRHNGVPPSNRWKRIKSDAEAKDAIGAAKAELAQARRRPAFFNRQRRQTPTPKNVTGSGDGSDTWSGNDALSGQSEPQQSASNDCNTAFYISARGHPDRTSAVHHPRKPEQSNGVNLTEAAPIRQESEGGS
jgi:hypothetical protein